MSGGPKILALDTSSAVTSVALVGGAGGDGVVALDGESGRHSADLMALVDRALAEGGLALAELDAIAVGVGPGSFTGLRIAMATAKGLCFATGRPLWTASSLAALALDAAARTPGALLVPVLDARRGEVFAGYYVTDGDLVAAAAPEEVVAPAEVATRVAGVRARCHLESALLVGDALDVHGEALAPAGDRGVDARRTPSALSIARLAAGGDRVDRLHTGSPAYIRPSAAEQVFPDGNPGGPPPRRP